MFFKKIIFFLVKIIPLRNTIVFESKPSFSDNPMKVYEKLKKMGYEKKYKLIWYKEEDWFDYKKDIVFFSRKNIIKCIYYLTTSKYLICGNTLLKKYRKNQKLCYISHGSPCKDSSFHYFFRQNVDLAINQSPFVNETMSKIFATPLKVSFGLGYPRVDDLINSDTDVHSIFNFTGKIIFWFPTLKKRRNSKIVEGSGKFIDLFDNFEMYNALNNYLKQKNVLIIIKLHYASSFRELLELNYSNIKFVDENFFTSHNTNSYKCLSSTDALLTDYSSVFYDYLCLDKPIGFVWSDFNEMYNYPGLLMDYIKLSSEVGPKIYNFKDLCKFIDGVNSNVDSYKKRRSKIKDLIFPYENLNSTDRVTQKIIDVFNL